jgi:hypothetical protein
MHHARRESKTMEYMYLLLAVLSFGYLCFCFYVYFHFIKEIYLEMFSIFAGGWRDFNASI